MPNGPADPVPSADAAGGGVTRTIRGRDRASRPFADKPADLPTRTAEVAPAHAATDVVPHERLPEVVRYGPGVPGTLPAGHPELTAERIWRVGIRNKPFRRRPRLGRLVGWTLTVILLAVSGVLLYPRIHHAPIQVTGVAVTQQARDGCGADVTGRITTNGSAGTVSYQWLFPPSQQRPQPLSQSVLAGQRTVYVTIVVEGAGHGSASQMVTLQVLGPDTRAASAVVAVSCR